MVKDTLAQTETKMKKSVEALHHHLASVRTGRASPALLDQVQVEYYGSNMPISQLANVSVPEARMLTIQPWDQTAIKAIEKGDSECQSWHQSHQRWTRDPAGHPIS